MLKISRPAPGNSWQRDSGLQTTVFENGLLYDLLFNSNGMSSFILKLEKNDLSISPKEITFKSSCRIISTLAHPKKNFVRTFIRKIINFKP